VKTLTLYQPHADMAALGLKPYETRSWRTIKEIGKPLVIHSGKGGPKRLALKEPFAPHYEIKDGKLVKPLRLGVCLAVVIVESCAPARTVREYLQHFVWNGTPEQKANTERALAMGDFTDGRWAWKLKVLCTLENIFPISGARLIWEVPSETAKVIKAQCWEKGVKL